MSALTSMKLVSLKKFSEAMEAEVVQSKLEAFGIESVLQRDPLPGAGSLVQGAEIFVQEDRLLEARHVLGETPA